ncbi:MAG: hypothetical protein HXY52_01840 [Nitrospirae bacterium]|jgi:hypothetical protein|nr:hypothetical protein [Nitrospirota bacterium]
MKVRIIILTNIIILLFFNSVNAKPLNIYIKEANIFYEDSLNSVARETAGKLPSIIKELEESLGLRMNSSPMIFLIKGSSNFQKTTGSDLIVAYAIPIKNSVFIDTSRVFTKPFNLETTLKHELCHIMLHQNIDDSNLPRWFDEGICQWVSGGISEIISNQDNNFLEKAILSDKLISFQSLYRFPEERNSVLLAYQESKSFIEYISEKYGDNVLRKIIKNLSSGRNINESFHENISISLYQLEQNWQSSLKKKHTWFLYLSNNIYTIIFLFLSILTIYGFYRLIKRKREYKDEEEIE